MIETLSLNLLIGFFVLVLGLLSWRLFRDKEIKELSFEGAAQSLKVHSCFLVPLLLLFGIAHFLGLSLAGGALFLLAGFAIPLLVSLTGLSSETRALLILLLTVSITLFVPEEGYRVNFAALIAGLVSWKSVDFLLISKEAKGALADFLPSFLWLVGIYWTKTVDTATWLPMHQKLILGVLCVSILMRWIQGMYLSNDKLYFKRISLAVTGSLFLLIYINQFIVSLDLGKMAVIAGAGFFLAYLFDAMEKTCDPGKRVLSDLKKVVFVGIFTLLISRLFGMLGLVVLAISMLVSTTSGVALLAAAFWAGRVFAQSFIFEFNSNMTGINIMHPYAGAALFAGFFLSMALSLLIRHSDRMMSTILFFTATVLAPVASIYFLHAEPTASLLYAALVSSTLFAIMAPSIYQGSAEEEDSHKQSALVLIPGQLLAYAILSNELISKGNTANIQERMIALAVITLIAALVLWLAYTVGSVKKPLDEEASA